MREHLTMSDLHFARPRRMEAVVEVRRIGKRGVCVCLLKAERGDLQ